MADPRRIQRQRVKGWRMPAGAVYVGRPSRWGNPYKIGGRDFDGDPIATVEHTIAAYRRWIRMFHTDDAKEALAGRDLACWCPLDQPCHADVLLEVAR